MSQSEKSMYYQALKAAGVQFDQHYRHYSVEQLQAAYERLGEAAPPLVPKQVVAPPEPSGVRLVEDNDAAAAFFGMQQAKAPVPVAPANPNEMAGQRTNTQQGEPIRVDEQGRVWYQEEVRKPGFPKPRGRRVLTYMDSGAEMKTVQNGEYMESFEVSGDPANARPAEVKITLPSYQVGIYRDPRYPFKVHTYNEVSGFDLYEVQDFYGGPERVPAEVKRMYVENVLCYDMRTVVQAIETEHRQLLLAGRIPQ